MNQNRPLLGYYICGVIALDVAAVKGYLMTFLNIAPY
jgi:hypothetical protein